MYPALTALAEPNRLQIVELLRDGPRSVGEIVKQLQLSQPQISRHLRILHEAGLVEVQPQAQQRIYRLHGRAFKDLDEWISTFRVVWEERLDGFENYMKTIQAEDR
ncbi:ArsR/SmtB family transcription factor [Antrihabitans spumae]|uniref:ArsR/SmtB family transcription factor n=1 Tax=Antrihabitans spumae TaxID=3373370 RepID=A0ABW7KX87_9NOCA